MILRMVHNIQAKQTDLHVVNKCLKIIQIWVCKTNRNLAKGSGI